MASPDYVAFLQGSGGAAAAFVDDVSGSGGTLLNAVDFNHLANDPAAHADSHINGVSNHHGSVDILDYSGAASTTLSEAQSPLYTNTTLLGDIVIGGIHYYSQNTRNDQWATLFKNVIGGSGTLTTRATTLGTGALSLTALTTILGGSGSPTFAVVTASEFVGVAPNNTTPAGLFKNDATDDAGYIFLVTDHGAVTVWVGVTKTTTSVGNNLTVTGTSGLTGNVSMGGTLSVTGTTTHTGAVTFVAAPVFQVGTTMSSLIADYKASTNVSAATITIGAGPAFLDSAGNWLGPFGGRTATLPSQPTGTNIQYVWLSMAPSTGAITVTGGTVGASPAIPVFPTGNEPIALVTWRGTGSLPSGVVASGDIQDARFWGHTIGAVVGLTSASTLWTVGVPSTSGDTSGVQGTTILKGTATGTVNSETFTPLNTGGTNSTSANVGIYGIGSGDVANEGGGTPDTNLGFLISGHISKTLASDPNAGFVISGATIAFTAGATLMINGHMKFNAAQSGTATASSSAGLRDVWADSTSNGGVSGNQFTITLSARGTAFSTTPSSAPNGNCRYVGTVVWDGSTNIYNTTTTFQDLSNYGYKYGATQYKMQPIEVHWTGGGQSISSSSDAAITLSASATFVVTRPTSLLITGSLMVFNPSANMFALGWIIDSGADSGSPAISASNHISSVPGRFSPKDNTVTENTMFLPWTIKSYNPGRYAIGISASASTGNFTANEGQLIAIPYQA